MDPDILKSILEPIFSNIFMFIFEIFEIPINFTIQFLQSVDNNVLKVILTFLWLPLVCYLFAIADSKEKKIDFKVDMTNMYSFYIIMGILESVMVIGLKLWVLFGLIGIIMLLYSIIICSINVLKIVINKKSL